MYGKMSGEREGWRERGMERPMERITTTKNTFFFLEKSKDFRTKNKLSQP